MSCMCGDTECLSCGTAQGTYREPEYRVQDNTQDGEPAAQLRVDNIYDGVSVICGMNDPDGNKPPTECYKMAEHICNLLNTYGGP